jgi:orotate phosphoribosyltransferase
MREQIYSRLVKGLFETDAVRICGENKPFWYTSGKIGPYYINTHFLFGSEAAANNLLTLIDKEKSSAPILHLKLFDAVMNKYNNDPIYKSLIDDMISYIKDNVNLSEIKYISGGERRDWFFSIIIAHFLNKPHITIFKDLSMVLLDKGQTCEVPDLNGSEVLHIADLITEASSYERAWVPAIKSAGGRISVSLVVIDRKQGGKELLESLGVVSLAMAGIDLKLFDKALEMNYINQSQFDMVKAYIENPTTSMKDFINNHPEFISESLAADLKTAERARLCLDKSFYK